MATCPELPHNVTGSQTSRTDDMNLIRRFLSGYTENFLLAVTLWPLAFNVVLFMPLGFIAGRLLRWGFWRSLVVGFLASLLIEAAQGTGLFGIYPYSYRTADVDDLIYNTSGAALGWACAAALARVLPPGALAAEGEVTHAPGVIRRCGAVWLDTLLVTLVSLVVGGGIGLVLAMIGASEGMRSHAMDLVLYATFLWVELVAPWRHAGSTPGGAFVRMSCETKTRSGWRRTAFYVARLVALGSAYFFFPILWPVLALFFLFARRMPYDFI